MTSAITAIARTGLDAAQSQLGAAAHNIANAQTPGFKRQTVQQADAGPGVVVTLSSAEQVGDDLVTDVVNQRAAALAFKANLRVIETERDMLGALLDVRA